MIARILILAAIAAMLLSCAGKKSIQQQSALLLSNCADKNVSGFEIDGSCDVWIRAGKLRTRARIALKGDMVSVALVDELGVPLEQVVTDSSKLDVIRIFPPMSREAAARTGLLLRAYALATNKQYEKNGSYAAPLPQKYSMNAFARPAGPDSLHVFAGAQNPEYRCFFDESSFFVLQNADTVIHFVSQ